eukprot:COSAG02_NODE_11415_length_1728_cov_42.854512_3_plen_219_part_00
MPICTRWWILGGAFSTEMQGWAAVQWLHGVVQGTAELAQTVGHGLACSSGGGAVGEWGKGQLPVHERCPAGARPARAQCVAAAGELAGLRRVCPLVASRWSKTRVLGCCRARRSLVVCVLRTQRWLVCLSALLPPTGATGALPDTNVWAFLCIALGHYAPLSHSPASSLVHIIWYGHRDARAAVCWSVAAHQGHVLLQITLVVACGGMSPDMAAGARS